MSYTKTTWVNNTTPIDENNLNKIESGIKNNDINIGEENYDNTKTYEVGDIVRYNEKIYKCITAITTAENFDISKWEQTNIVEIVQSEKSKIYELIEAISTPIVGEGENITLNDTAEKRFENFDIEGNSEQETRSGKNKLKFSGLTSRTINGLTITNNKDGSITLNGTTTDTVSMTLSNNMYNLVAGKYYLSRNSIGTVSGTFTNILYGKNETAVNIGGLKSEGMIITATTDYQEYYLWLYVTSGITFTNYTMKPQLETGTVKTDWELYGASPSPDYPSEVKSCGDDVNELNPIAGGSQGINSSVIEGKISFSGTANTTFANITSITVGVIKKGTYIFSINEAKNYSVRLRMYYTESEYIDAIIPENKKEVVIELTNDVIKYYTYIYPLTAGTNYNDFIYEKLQKGTTVTPYSPYGQGCINEVISNYKNLFIKGKGIVIGKFLSSDGSIGTDTSLFYQEYYIEVTGGTQLIVSAENGENFRIAEYDSSKIFIRRNLNTGGTKTYTITLSSNCRYIRVSTTLANLDSLIIQEGSTIANNQSQTYTIPTQQPFRAIGDTRDTFIIKENGKWYERHYIARKIFDGTENWFTSVNSQFELLGTNYKNYKDGGTCISSHFIYSMELDTCVWIGNSSFILIRDTRYTNVNDWKSYLAEQYANGTPVYVDYVLATPTDIECTSQQTEILNHMYIKAKSYKGVTHIYSNDEVSPNCYVEAVKDLTTLIQ